MTLRPFRTGLACTLVAAIALAGCGGGSNSSTSSSVEVGTSKPAPPKSDFPNPEGRTLTEILDLAAGEAPVVAPASSVFYEGENRYSFGVFELDHTPISDAEVALYIAKVPAPKKRAGAPEEGKRPKGAVAQARREALDAPAMGPFPAAIESIGTKPAFRSQTSAEDADSPSVVYVTGLDFSSEGEWRIVALFNEDGELRGGVVPSAVVGAVKRVPRVGEEAPLIHTPTAEDVGGDLSKITTRIPPDTQNRVDFADALGNEPIVLLFATPQFCQSRVCGPVVDVAEQVKEAYGDEAAFVHMEIFNDNDPGKKTRPQVRAYGLPTEPWLFVIDRQGVVQTAVEGAFGVDQLTRAVRGATGE